jgi:hypothetical protein
MPMRSFAGFVASRPKNKLLSALPATDFERLRPDLETIPTRPRQVF